MGRLEETLEVYCLECLGFTWEDRTTSGVIYGPFGVVIGKAKDENDYVNLSRNYLDSVILPRAFWSWEGSGFYDFVTERVDRTYFLHPTRETPIVLLTSSWEENYMQAIRFIQSEVSILIPETEEGPGVIGYDRLGKEFYREIPVREGWRGRLLKALVMYENI